MNEWKKIYSLVHAKTVRLPRRCVKTRLQSYIGAICHCHCCIDGILLSPSANMVGASRLQGISWRTKANQKRKNILNEWYSVGSRGGTRPPSRLQNSPYFCVFKYARAVKKNVWNEAENRERDWGETLKNTDCPFCIRYIRSNYPLLPATGNSHWLNFDASCHQAVK